MNSKTLKQAFLMFFASALLALVAYISHYDGINENVQGKSSFGNTAAEFERISTIEMNTPKGKITFDKSDSIWLLREADSYYAGYQLMNAFEGFVKNSKILRQEQMNAEDEAKYFGENSRDIKLLSANGKTLSEITISMLPAGNNLSYAKIKGLDGIYVIENNMDFPLDKAFWLQQPLLALPNNMIESIKINEKIALRDKKDGTFFTKDNQVYKADELLKTLEFLLFTKVLSAQNFDESKFSEQKTMKITTFDGVIVDITLYKNGDEYWVKQKISTSALPTTSSNEYVKNNAFLYDYWYFKLSQMTGRRLWLENIM